MTRGYWSGELARAVGLSSDTLRFYERQGLLPRPRRLDNGYRLYPPEALARIQLIQGALVIGFSLAELARILRARDRGSPPCHEVRKLAAEKLQEIEKRLEEMTQFRDTLRGTLRLWDARLAATSPRRKARLLESISAKQGTLSARFPLTALRFQKNARRRKK